MMVRPTILIDMRKHRIRIHKHTLQAIGDPDFVMLIINPIEYTLGIKYGVPDDKLALRIRKSTLRNDYELYSTPLMAALHQLCPEWKERELPAGRGTHCRREHGCLFHEGLYCGGTLKGVCPWNCNYIH